MFLNGLLTGSLLGLVLMFIWRAFTRAKRKERYDMAMKNASLMGMMRSSDIERFLGFFPKWVQFSEFEQVEWLNVQLKELWPYVNKAVQDTIVETVDPMLKEYEENSAAISEIVFTRTDLGSRSPQVEGVKVHSMEHNQVIMDMDLNWQGNCKFKLRIRTAALATITPCVQDLSFTGTLRLILELTDKMPVVAAYLVAINRRAAPPDYDLSYSLTGAGLNALPGLPKMVEDIIHSSIDDMLLWPRRIHGAIMADYDDSHLDFLYDGVVVVTVVKGADLKNMDTFGKSDPRVVLYMRKSHKAATRIIDNNLFPVWDEVFELPVDDVHTSQLYFEVQDSDGLNTFQPMGFAILPLEDVFREPGQKEFPLPLVNSLNAAELTAEKMGSITVTAVYRNFEDKETRKAVKEKEDERVAKAQNTTFDKCLGAQEATAAIAKAVESAKRRAENMMQMRGVAQAAEKLIALQMGGLEEVGQAPISSAKKGFQSITKRVAAGVGGGQGQASNGVSNGVSTSSAASSSTPPTAPLSVPSPGHTTPLSAPTPGRTTPPSSTTPVEPTASAVSYAASAFSAAAGTPPGVAGEAPPSPTATVQSSVVEDEERPSSHSKHRVSGFFRGRHGHGHGHKGTDESATAGGKTAPERPPTPTRKRGSFFGGLKKD